jgi:excinuclease UvrABC ATPase subunit
MIPKAFASARLQHGRPPGMAGNLRDMLITLGYDVDRPWRELPKNAREWILHTDEQPVVPVYIGYDANEARRATGERGSFSVSMIRGVNLKILLAKLVSAADRPKTPRRQQRNHQNSHHP